MNTLSFDPYRNLFSDGTILDWWVTESPETSWITSDSFKGPIDSRHMKARVSLEKDKIGMPIARFASHTRCLDARNVKNALEFMTAIVDFYAQKIDQDWLDEARPGPPDCVDFYHADVLEKCASRRPTCILDLVGSAQTEGLSDDPTHRRHPFLCNGRVRYEGMSGNLLLLGS